MDRRTVASAHERIDGLEKEVVAIKTEVKIQFKDTPAKISSMIDLFTRVKRLESILLAAAGSIIGLLVAVLMKMDGL